MHAAIQLQTKLRMTRAFAALIIALSLSVSLTPAKAQSIDAAPIELPAETADHSLKALLEVLKDDAARTALIEELETTVAKAADSANTVDEPVEKVVSLGRRIALITQEIGQETVATLSGLWT